jgi:hypothetical protein
MKKLIAIVGAFVTGGLAILTITGSQSAQAAGACVCAALN